MTDDTEPSRVSVDVRRGTPDEDELAALIAVVTEAYTTEAGSAVADDAPAASGWMQTRRSLRAPLRRDLGWPRG